MQDAKEEVRSRLNIEDVIGEYVHLQRSGRNFKGLSPFTSERTASFYVSPDKNIWHDFSSNKGGDIFSFVMEVEGIDFREALEILARKAGVDLSLYEKRGSNSKLKKRLSEAVILASKYYQQSLVKNQKAIEYVFKARGLKKETVQEFQIGYAPDSGDALVKFLAKKGFSKKELDQAGLTNRFGTDLFRGRMTVALMDGAGLVIGFTARIIGDIPNAPKYINTSQTLLYDKSRHVFGLSQAKEAIRKNNYAVIVEGNLDVISSHQAGVKQVVATAGTAMTEYHLKALSRLTSDIRLAFDGDKAGVAATERAIAIAQNVGVELSIVTMPDGFKDADELVKKDVKLWQTAIEKSKPAVDWVLAEHYRKLDLKTAAGKRDFTTVAANVIRFLKDPVEQEHYLQKVAEVVGTSVDSLKQKMTDPSEKVETALKPVSAEIKKAAVEQAKDLRATAYQDSLVALMLVQPDVRHLLANITDDMLATEERQAVVGYLRSNPEADYETALKDLKNFKEYVKIVSLQADARYESWSDSEKALETAQLVRQVITEHTKIKKSELEKQLRDAEIAQDDETAQKLLLEINQLNSSLRREQNGKK